jgi:hypothetical protein
MYLKYGARVLSVAGKDDACAKCQQQIWQKAKARFAVRDICAWTGRLIPVVRLHSGAAGRVGRITRRVRSRIQDTLAESTCVGRAKKSKSLSSLGTWRHFDSIHSAHALTDFLSGAADAISGLDTPDATPPPCPPTRTALMTVRPTGTSKYGK